MFADIISEPQLARAYRKTTITSTIIGVIGLVALVLTRNGIAGIGLCIGLGVGVVNLRLVQASVSRIAASGHEKPKRPLAMHTFARLAVLTAIAIGMLVVEAPLGLGMLIGMMIFQFAFLANLAKAVFGTGRVS
ncbi:MAG: ATP synthase subunit I [Actinomycetota bacterium]|nr:ATP synthase subunit I [Actinomycetota bacterium]